jgi:hypothetical protein
MEDFIEIEFIEKKYEDVDESKEFNICSEERAYKEISVKCLLNINDITAVYKRESNLDSSGFDEQSDILYTFIHTKTIKNNPLRCDITIYDKVKSAILDENPF